MSYKILSILLLVMLVGGLWAATATCGTNLSTANTVYDMTGACSRSSSQANGYNITESNVTLDCHGYTITGANASAKYAIYDIANDTTIKNCIASNFSTAIYLLGANRTLITNTSAATTRATSRGIEISGPSTGTNITNCSATSLAYYGIQTDNLANSNIINNTYASGTYGILLTNVTYNLVANSTLYTTSTAGLYVWTNAWYNNITNCTITSTAADAVWIAVNSSYNKITNCTMTGGTNGVRVDWNGGNITNNTVYNSTITGSTAGIYLQRNATNNSFVNNTITGSPTGISILTTPWNNVFCWNNITGSTVDVSDLNGSNRYNSSLCNNEGNVWNSVINGSAQVNGSSISIGYPSLYVGFQGTGYPYNNSTSSGLFSCNFAGCADYAPLTKTKTTIAITVNSLAVTPNPPALLDDLNCNANITSSAYPSYNVSYEWYQNGANMTAQAGNTTAANNTLAVINTLSHLIIIQTDNYSCRINAFNGTDNSGWVMSGNDTEPAFTCGNLSTAGATYSMASNLSINSSTCFNITAANVTLECNGFAISGDNTPGMVGVYSTGYNTTIRDCNIMGFTNSITLNGTAKGTIFNNTLASALQLSANSTGSTIYLNNFTNGGVQPTYYLTISHAIGLVAPENKVVKYKLVDTNISGTQSCWIGQNLGANYSSSGATISNETVNGWFWQFNRKQGYKFEGSARTPATSWITSISEANNWTPGEDPCTSELGTGWRVANNTEWTNVDTWSNYNQAYSSVLKLHTAGRLASANGSLENNGTNIYQWTTLQQSSSNGYSFTGSIGTFQSLTLAKAYGASVRCIRLGPCSDVGVPDTNYINDSNGSNYYQGAANSSYPNYLTYPTIATPPPSNWLVDLNRDCYFNQTEYNYAQSLWSAGNISFASILDTIDKINTTYCWNQGNAYQNVLNGSVNITGTVGSSIAGLYIGNAGSAYPYNNSTSGKVFGCNFAGCADYAPLTPYLTASPAAGITNITAISVTPAAPTTIQNVSCNLTASDSINSVVNIAGNWTKNGAVLLAFAYNGVVNNTATLVANLTYLNYTDLDNISCQAIATGSNTSTLAVAANVTIQSTSETFYIDATSGSDANNGRTTGTPWKTLAKANSQYLSAGDSILLKRGEGWLNQTLNLTGTNITVAAYGTGAIPQIDAGIPLTGWTAYSGSIYKSMLGAGKTVYDLFADGDMMEDAHWPNAGYEYPTDNLSTTYSFNDTGMSLTAAQVNGSILTVRFTAFSIKQKTINNYNAATHTLNFTPSQSQPMTTGSGYFLADMLWMLDSPGEWWYNNSSGYVYLWAPGSVDPNGMSTTITTSDNNHALLINNSASPTVANISLTRGGDASLDIENSNNTLLSNVTASFGTSAAIQLISSNQSNITGCYVHDANRYGIYSEGTRNNISNNTIVNTTMNELYRRATQQGWAIALLMPSNNSTVTHNLIYTAGYIGIEAEGNFTNITYNVINQACNRLPDCGAIYENYNENYQTYEYNIIANTVKNLTGSPSDTAGAHGFYFDEVPQSLHSAGNDVARFNTIINTSDAGFFVHFLQNITILNNTIYNASHGVRLSDNNANLTANMSIANNTFLMVQNSLVMQLNSWTGVNTSKMMKNISGNTYMASPNTSVGQVNNNSGSSQANYTFPQWTSLTGEVAAINIWGTTYNRSTMNSTPMTDVLFLVNGYSETPISVNMNNTYCDLLGNDVASPAVVPAWSGRALLPCYCNLDGVLNNKETALTCPADANASTANLTVICGAGGASCTGSTTNYTPFNATISATASTDYTFSSWGVTSGNCTILNASASTTDAIFISGTSNCSVQASFTYTPPPATGSLYVACTVGAATCTGNHSDYLPFNHAISTSAATNWTFSNWTLIGDCSLAGSNVPSTNVAVYSGDCNATAYFNYTAPAIANLIVSCGAGGASCTGSDVGFTLPASKPITATASTNYNFTDWSVTSGNCTITDSLDNTTFADFTASTSNCTVQANFIYSYVATANLSVLSGPGGTATGNATDFVIPTSRIISATPSFTYAFANWSVTSGNCTIANNASATTYAVFLATTSNCEVTASFVSALSPASVQIYPAIVYYNGNANCMATTSGNETNSTVYWEWYNNFWLILSGTSSVATNSTPIVSTINNSYYTYGDALICKAYYTNGNYTSGWGSSQTVMITEQNNTANIPTASYLLNSYWNDYGGIVILLMSMGFCYYMHFTLSGTMLALSAVSFGLFMTMGGYLFILIAIVCGIAGGLLKFSVNT